MVISSSILFTHISNAYVGLVVYFISRAIHFTV